MFPKATQECRVHSSFYLRVSFFKIAQKVANNLGYVPLLEILSLRIFINRPIWSHWLREIEEGSCYSLNVFFGVLLTTLTMASPVASMASVVRIRRCFERPVPNKRHWITKGHFISPSPPHFLTFGIALFFSRLLHLANWCQWTTTGDRSCQSRRTICIAVPWLAKSKLTLPLNWFLCACLLGKMNFILLFPVA